MKKYLFLVPVLFILGCGNGGKNSTETKIDDGWKCFCDTEIKALTSIKNTYALDLPIKITDITANKCEIAAFDSEISIGDLSGYGYDSNGTLWAEIAGDHLKLKDLLYKDHNYTIKPRDTLYILSDIILPYKCYTNKLTIKYNLYYNLVKEKKEIVIQNPQYDQSQVYKSPNSDPLYQYQWHLKNTGQSYGLINAIPGEDINVEPVWNNGITGKGIKVAVIDAGVDIFHPDLKDNIDIEDSYNYHNGTHNTTPGLTNNEAHGTAVAGLIAAKGWNGIGTRGVAPNATIVSLNALEVLPEETIKLHMSAYNIQLMRLLDALTKNVENIDIYNNSWGGNAKTLQDDFNSSTDISSFDTQTDYGVKFGRHGLGAIYVKSAGNDGNKSNANFEQIATNGNWIIVSALGSNGKRTVYSTPGSAVLVSAPGGGVNPMYTKEKEIQIVTTDLPGDKRGYDVNYKLLTSVPHFDVKGNENFDYTYRMNGTSAAAPITSGIIALMLEANPNLTYRDIQIILAKTARKNDPDDSYWQTNAAGLHFNYYYGFGAVDATAAVKMAKNFKSVGGYYDIKSSSASAEGESNNSNVELNFDINDSITIENVIITITITGTVSPQNLKITLISPSKTKSLLIDAPNSLSPGESYNNVRLLSKNFIEENSKGKWKLDINSSTPNDSFNVKATLKVTGH